MLFVNFKTYESATGEKAVELAKICEKVSKETGKEIVCVVQAVDIYRVSQAVKLKVFAQHIDDVDYGSNTGFIMIDAVKQAGAVGTIINHSEHRIPLQKIKDAVEKCKHKMFPVLVCAQDPDEVEQMTRMEPDWIAYEPPELIGGDISVSTAKPELITESVERAALREKPLIVGAGVKNAIDVKVSIDLGAKGILVASGVTKSEDPEAALKDLVSNL
ncbi:MAG: triose-phosphate isomerase [Candidatus Woesearchaeota archaeon]